MNKPISNPDHTPPGRGFSVFQTFTKFIAWIQIAVSPLLLGIAAGFIAYYQLPKPYGILLGALLVTGGLAAGIVWANKVARKQGSINFISRVSATPELDDPEMKPQ
ncbi:MAG: hypothetical protein ABWZ25_17995 [Chitinophagaceae bacterium]